MKYTITTLACAIILGACSAPAAPPVAATDSTAVAAGAPEERAQGLYKGDFGGAPIFITINYTSPNHLAGYNVHKGLRRNLSGTLKQEGDRWVATLNEPGDHPFDGHFKLVFDKEFTTAKGHWEPLDKKALQEKNFTLNFVKRTEENESISVLNYPFTSEQGELYFDEDGSCLFDYYPKVTDSTYAEQSITLKGTWEQKGDTIHVNWQPNEEFPKRNSIFILQFNEDKTYSTGLEGEDITFNKMIAG
ncbi:hypothetical protein SAMN04488505_1011027 [Chitinophaga rupis]|uniref:Lipoprotein n=1 Tax=Chitinophaga rupis TaxID=573321 RepID=A0A1H7KIA6_9BACT|nr:hypothetical protein [Chitinophaga rupis]SEK86236.1 hypothetical protein SAMN04488505_1011027 [Chitinophaga rupis]